MRRGRGRVVHRAGAELGNVERGRVGRGVRLGGGELLGLLVGRGETLGAGAEGGIKWRGGGGGLESRGGVAAVVRSGGGAG